MCQRRAHKAPANTGSRINVPKPPVATLQVDALFCGAPRMKPPLPRANIDALEGHHMDIRVNAVRGVYPAALSPEKLDAQPDAFSNEAATRRNRDRDAFNKARDHATANNLSPERAITLQRHLALMHEMDDAIAGKSSRFSPFESELAGVVASETRYRKLLQDETEYGRMSWTTQGWNLLAGGNGFLLCFGLGTLTASALGKPWAALAISPLVWSLTERLIPMIRATSWRNKHADVDYPHIMRITSRAVRDWLRQMFGLNGKKYLVKGQVLTASQYRQTLSLFNAWKGKVATDDLPYFSYTFWYSVRNIVLNLCTTPAFLKTTVGMAVSLVSLGISGTLAGASTSWIFQSARRDAYKKENPDTWRSGEIIVKSAQTWRAEKELLEAKISLLDAYEENSHDDEVKKSTAYTQAALKAEIYKAGMKSGRLTSIVYEIACLLQKKDTSGEDGLGEVAGNRIAFLCGMLGKAAALVPAILFNHLVAMKYASGEYGLAASLIAALSLNTLLIIGFSFRRELEFPWRYMLALVYACGDVLNEARGIEDKYAHNSVATAVEVSTDKDSDNSVEPDSSDASSISETLEAPKQRFTLDRTSPDGASANDETSSESA
jgi:hypothetical protein